MVQTPQIFSDTLNNMQTPAPLPPWTPDQHLHTIADIPH